MNLIVEVGNRELLTGKKVKKASGCVSRFFQKSDRSSIPHRQPVSPIPIAAEMEEVLEKLLQSYIFI
ncbi:hypothetical protein NIES4074_10250 [Cylindrospermum sp. NIES-4074]|nr:hypothetical protein NIES4074_10250 [Cylindrospermum sp. NIES-4074]